MAKKHSALTGADLHAPQGFSNEGSTVLWHVTQSVNKVNVSSSFLPTDNSSFDLGSSTASWNNLYLTGNIASTGNVSGSVISGSKLHIVGDSFIGGNLTLGDADTDSISITADLTSNLTPNADATYDLGSTTKGWRHIHSTGQISGSIISGSVLYGDGSNLTGITSTFVPTGSSANTTGNVQISGSLIISGSTLTVRTGTDSGPPTASTAIYTNNITNGYPTSNAWQESLDGSYFNNFDNTTHVSEILRFMAGIISHSIDTASPTANTKTFASVDTNDNSLGNTDTIGGYLPQEHGSLSNATIDYLNFKDWWRTGGICFSGLTVYYQNGATHYLDFDSNSGGSTTVRSSADSELFGVGGLDSGAAVAFNVKVHATQSFSDTGSIAAPTAASNTFTTQSVLDLSVSSFGASGGLTLAKIASANPAVIPAAYQDGKFENVGGTSQMSGSLTRKYHATKGSFTSVSSSGWYRFHDLKVGMSSGSGLYQEVNGTTKNRFWAPTTTIDAAIGANTLADVGTTHRPLTATSRSLSGVPYLLDATFEVSTKITGLFNPAYAASTTLVDMTAASVGVGTATITGDTVSTSGGEVQTSGKVFESDGVSAVNSGVPRYDDIVIMTGSVSYDSGNSDSISQTGVSDTTFTVATKARNRNGSQSTLDTQTILYHSASTFSQPLASGSLGIYGRAQSYDGGTLQGTTEVFTGEDFRIALADNVQAFNGTAWTTTYELDQLGNFDLQVKPGYLVDPGGDYRYWYPENYGTGTYKYYIRRFQTDGSTYSSMTVNLNNNTLIAWNATTNGVSCAILFESSGNGSGNNSSLGVARIYDPVKTTSNLIEADMAADNFKNPFSTAISLYGNSGGSIASSTYTIPIRNADGMYLDSNDNELYVIVRYKGDPTPLDDITLTFS